METLKTGLSKERDAVISEDGLMGQVEGYHSVVNLCRL